MAVEMDKKKTRLRLLRMKLQKKEALFDDELSQLDTLEKKTIHINDIATEEKNNYHRIVKEVEELKQTVFKRSQDLFKLRREEEDLLAEIAGAKSQNQNQGLKVDQLDQQACKQREILYNAEFQRLQLERKVARACGERDDSERCAMNAKIDQLSKLLEEKTSEHIMLSQQVKCAEDDLKAARRSNAALNKEAGHVTDGIRQIKLECDNATKSVKVAVKEKEDKMVEHDLQRLDVKRLQDLLELRVDEVFGLENRKHQLQLSMEKRRHEIEVHMELLRAELKVLQLDIHRATLDQREREVKVCKLKSKYEVIVGKMKADEENEERSPAYYVIKAAQEREILQRDGEELSANIDKAEKEVLALNNVLSKLNEKNNAYRGSFRRAEGSEKMKEHERLRGELDTAFDQMRLRRSEEQSSLEDLEQCRAKLNNAVAEESRLQEAVNFTSRRLAEFRKASPHLLRMIALHAIDNLHPRCASLSTV
eukprot:scaffold1483_cov379-Prasinococcus_capsulatus_cf.AAC.14